MKVRLERLTTIRPCERAAKGMDDGEPNRRKGFAGASV